MLYGFKAMKEEVHIVGYVFIIAYNMQERGCSYVPKEVMLMHTLIPRNEVNDLTIQASHCNE
jgi:hypothetical protein